MLIIKGVYITERALFSLSFEMCGKGNIQAVRVSVVIQQSLMKTLLHGIQQSILPRHSHKTQ